MSLLSSIFSKDKKQHVRIQGHIKCPFCLTENGRSKIFKTKKQYLIHISTHNEISDSKKRAARYYGTNYFTMLQGGILS